MPNYYLIKALTGERYLLSTVNRTVNIDEGILGSTTQLYSGYHVRDILPDKIKRRVSISWQWLPHRDVDVIDGGMGFLTLLNLWRYNIENGLLIFEKPNQDGTTESFQCYIDEEATTGEMQRRDTADMPNNSLFWHVDLQLVEK